jgi:hypothetical protein
MERRNRSIKALNELIYIDSLDSFEKGDALVRWGTEYLQNDIKDSFDLDLDDLKKLEELFFKNINFLKRQKEIARREIIKVNKVKKFLNN